MEQTAQGQMSSWKDSSDFALLTAAVSQAKKLQNQKFTDTKKTESISYIEPVNFGEKSSSSREETNTFIPQYSDFSEDFKLPMTESFLLKQHKSTVSALEFESSGSRFLSGSHDTTVAYWDFNGMVKDEPVPFRFIEPMGSYTVKSSNLSF